MTSSVEIRLLLICIAIASFFATLHSVAQEPLTGSLGTHDPSTMIKEDDRYYSFNTGVNIASKFSTNRLEWTDGATVFTAGTRPSWITNAVPNFVNNFWAPDIIYLNGLYHLYYSCSTFGVNTSAIGLVTSPSLSSPVWTDQGAVIQSNGANNYNAIDPSVLLASNGTLWMAFGSFWDGIKMIQLDPTTGKRITPGSTVYSLARHPPLNPNAIEAACLIERSNYFYLFVNWDSCCAGLNSSYQIRVGRSTSVTGPYRDRNNLDMYNGGGTLFLEGTGKYLGPGHAGILAEGEANWFTYHYYDATTPNGTSRLAMGHLTWSADGWPQLTNDWCAFYPFEADAREHRGLFNGTLRNGASVTNEPGRSKVLSLNGTNEFVTLPIAVANASTFATWVKWNGGGAWQRIFDFGNNTNRYLFLTPSNGLTGRLRFAITTNGTGTEQILDGPTALPMNSWCHVAVTLNGTRGLLYLNGEPVSTNNSITLRPWQARSRTNYIGESQFGPDPMFNGRIDSLRIFGRALSADEVRQLSRAHPSLAHRYSFDGNSSDSFGMAHGRLNGNAMLTNNALVLSGASGDYMDMPGGLVSGCSAVTLEFWATFGVNGDGSRVFDFGNTNGTSGTNTLSFSPHTDTSSHRLTLATSGGISDLDVAGPFDGQTVHVVCIADPTTGYSAIYTNRLLESETTGSLSSLSSVSTALSYLGRSLFSADAWLNAEITEFRIYHGRLTPEEIAADYAGGPEELAIPVQLSVSNDLAGLTTSWPAYAVGFDLESSESLDSSAVWSPVSGTSTLQDNSYRFTLSLTNITQFLRLHR